MAPIKTYQQVMLDLAHLIRAVDQFLAIFESSSPKVDERLVTKLREADAELRHRLAEARK